MHAGWSELLPECSLRADKSVNHGAKPSDRCCRLGPGRRIQWVLRLRHRKVGRLFSCRDRRGRLDLDGYRIYPRHAADATRELGIIHYAGCASMIRWDVNMQAMNSNAALKHRGS